MTLRNTADHCCDSPTTNVNLPVQSNVRVFVSESTCVCVCMLRRVCVCCDVCVYACSECARACVCEWEWECVWWCVCVCVYVCITMLACVCVCDLGEDVSNHVFYPWQRRRGTGQWQQVLTDSRHTRTADTDTFTYCYASQKNVFKAQRMKGEAITLLFQKTI